MQTDLKPLKIISASAGSGKTYNLVLQYLKILFSNPSPEAFKRVIAMTFTNKAAYEMKTRVMGALEEIAYPDEIISGERSKYLDQLLEFSGLTEAKAQDKARNILKVMLHEYEDFNLLTIDKFNLRLIRTFARDLNVEGDFNLELNTDLWLEKEIDRLMLDYGNPAQESLRKLTFHYAEKQLQLGEKWDLQRELKKNAKLLISEANIALSEQLSRSEYSTEKYLELEEKRKQICAKVLAAHTLLREEYEKASHEESNYIFEKHKLSRDKWLAFMADWRLYDSLQQNLYKNIQTDIDSGSPHKISQQFKSVESEGQLCAEPYFEITLRLQHYHYFGLMKLLNQRIQLTKANEHTLLISDFNRMLAQLIGESEAPFIYDRLGQRYDHILLDEFQDTSRLQWTNLIPLIHDLIAQNKTCFIVGDPKQSIYRFNNGSAEQFIALPEIFNPEQNPQLQLRSQLFKALGLKENLDLNWRSGKNIVEFNNSLYAALIESHSEGKISNFYASFLQTAKANYEGYVDFNLHKSNDYDEMKTFLISRVKEAIEDGYAPEDITILDRKKAYCKMYAKILSDEGFEVVSADSLEISSDAEVRLLISFFEFRLQSHSALAQRKLISHFLQAKSQGFESFRNYSFYADKKKNLDFEAFVKTELYSQDLGEDYERLIHLFEMGCRLFNVSQLENIYLHQLADYIFSWENKNGPNLKNFLEHYHQRGKKEVVQFPKGKGSIEILTTHKSKGLEFKVVILPRIYYTKKTDPLWVNWNGELVKSQASNFSNPSTDAHNEESENSLIDEFNVLYVATTRAKERLYGRVIASGNALADPFKTLFKKDTQILLGERLKVKAQEKSSEVSYLKPAKLSEFIWYPKIAIRTSDKVENENLTDAIQYGNQLHAVLAQVKSRGEIKRIIRRFGIEGKIDRVFENQLEKDCEQLFDLILTELFTGAEQILTEKTILLPNEKLNARPDLLVFKNSELILIDFKTGAKKSSHQKQINGYLSILKEMGHQNVRPCLIYTDAKIVVWVQPKLL